MKQYVILNEEMVVKEEAKIGITDLAVLRGYGIFDFFKTANNQALWFEDHLDRFYFSAAEMCLPVPVNRNDLKKLVQQLMDKNNLPHSGIRITLTGGYSGDGYSFEKPNLLIVQEPYLYNKVIFEKGIRLVTYEHQRQLPQIKTIDYLQAIRLQQYVKDNGAQDLLYQFQSSLLESPRANFFMINQHDEICTPADNILKGITRMKILELEGFTFKQSVIHPCELLTAKEAFISSTTKSVLPVLNIDGRQIGNGKPGDITREIWKRLLAAENSTIKNLLRYV